MIDSQNFGRSYIFVSRVRANTTLKPRMMHFPAARPGGLHPSRSAPFMDSREAAAAGDASASLHLGCALAAGGHGLWRDARQAAALLRAASEAAGDAFRPIRGLALLQLASLEASDDAKEALLRRAAAEGEPRAAHALALRLLSRRSNRSRRGASLGEGGASARAGEGEAEVEAEAEGLLRVAAAAGHAASQLALANLILRRIAKRTTPVDRDAANEGARRRGNEGGVHSFENSETTCCSHRLFPPSVVRIAEVEAEALLLRAEAGGVAAASTRLASFYSSLEARHKGDASAAAARASPPRAAAAAAAAASLAAASACAAAARRHLRRGAVAGSDARACLQMARECDPTCCDIPPPPPPPPSPPPPAIAAEAPLAGAEECASPVNGTARRAFLHPPPPPPSAAAAAAASWLRRGAEAAARSGARTVCRAALGQMYRAGTGAVRHAGRAQFWLDAAVRDAAAAAADAGGDGDGAGDDGSAGDGDGEGAEAAAAGAAAAAALAAMQRCAVCGSCGGGGGDLAACARCGLVLLCASVDCVSAHNGSHPIEPPSEDDHTDTEGGGEARRGRRTREQVPGTVAAAAAEGAALRTP